MSIQKNLRSIRKDLDIKLRKGHAIGVNHATVNYNENAPTLPKRIETLEYNVQLLTNLVEKFLGKTA